MSDVNTALTDADQASGYEEVVDGAAPQVVAEVTLSAAVIDRAYQDLKAALRKDLAAELHRVDLLYAEDLPDRKLVKTLEITAEAEVKIARAEVDRVTTLMNFLSTEALLKAGENIQ